MKSSMRAFGIGLFIAGATIALFEQFSPSADTKDKTNYEQQIKDYEKQIAKLNEQIDEKNSIAKEANEPAPSKQPKEDMTNTKEQNSEELNIDEVVEATIYIYEDVSIYTIGQQAEDLGIVENGRELELFLAKPEYSRSIQKGAFDLRSDMTIEQIAKIITGKKVE